jgi:hypothetical protein
LHEVITVAFVVAVVVVVILSRLHATGTRLHATGTRLHATGTRLHATGTQANLTIAEDRILSLEACIHNNSGHLTTKWAEHALFYFEVGQSVGLPAYRPTGLSACQPAV